MLIAWTSKSSEKDNNRNIFSNFRDCCFDFSSSFLFFNIYFKLQSRFITFFILGTDLSIPRILACWQFNIENKNNVASLSLLGDDDFFRPIDYKISTLIIKTFFISHYLLLIAIMQMTLFRMYHYRYFTQIYFFCLIFLNQVGICSSWFISIPFSLFNMEINLAFNLICEISDSCLVWIIRIKISSSFVS